MAFSPFVLLAQVSTQITTAGEEASTGLISKISHFFQFFFTQLPTWIAAFIVFGLSIGVAKIIRSTVETKISSKVDEEHQEIVILGGRIAYVSTLAIGITAALKIAGIDLTTILAAIAFGIGFALRDLIQNFLAGIYLLISRQFVIGDLIKINGIMGKIVEIQSRATIIKAIDGTRVIVPNSDLFSMNVINYTGNSTRRVVIPLYVSYDADLKYAIKIALKTIKNNPKILKKPAPSVIIKDYGDYTIDIVARFWVLTKDRWVKIRSDMICRFNDAFNEAGILIPYQTVHLETAQDTAEDEKISDATQKAMKEKMAKAAAEKKAKAMIGGDGATLADVPLPNTGDGVIPAVAPLVPAVALQEEEPPGAYQDESDIDDQTIDNKG